MYWKWIVWPAVATAAILVAIIAHEHCTRVVAENFWGGGAVIIALLLSTTVTSPACLACYAIGRRSGRRRQLEEWYAADRQSERYAEQLRAAQPEGPLRMTRAEWQKRGEA